MNVVYQIKCLTCFKIYIDSTIRRLNIRLLEHFRGTSSSVGQHLQECINVPPLNISEKLDIKILARDTDAVNLRIKEALLIKERRPQLT
jgi:hypothetical protein